MNTFKGLAVSPGLAVGNVERIDHGSTGLHRIVCDPFRERALYDVAVVLAKDELHRLCQHSQGADADILLFQIALLEDESFTNEIGDYIAAGAGGAAAVERAEHIFTARLNNVDNDYIKERATDVRDVCRRVVNILDGRPRRRPHLEHPSILVAEQFFPSDLFTIDRNKVLGLAAERDSSTSHAAIMARSLGIPMVVHLGEGITGFAAGQRAILDAENSCFIVQPTTINLNDANRRLSAGKGVRVPPDPVLALPSVTQDGTPFRLFCAENIISRAKITQDLSSGAEAIGLFRTESVMVDEHSEEKQLAEYEESLACMDGHPLVVRTCDPGLVGDADWAAEQRRAKMEDGPFYQPQLRALQRVSVPGDIRLLLPMVHSLQEWREANRKIEECRAKLKAEGVTIREKLPVGCIINSPAAAIMAGELLDEGASVLAIDLNDLTRLTYGLARYGEVKIPPEIPAVQRLISGVLQEAEKRGVLVYMCGISRDEISTIPRYLRLGLRNFCVECGDLVEVKKLLCAETLPPKSDGESVPR